MSDNGPDIFNVDLGLAAATAIVDQARYYRLKQGEKLAKRWESGAIEAIRTLESFPERAHLLQNPQLKNVRRIQMPRFPYFNYYEVRRAQRIVRILHIMHVSRDQKRILFSIQ